MEEERTTPWHALDIEAIFAAFETSPQGLTLEEATTRLTQCGPNRLRPPKTRGPIKRFAIQFHNVLIYILVGTVFVSAALEHWTDAGVIAAVVFINALIGFIQEGKAEKALDAIRNMLSHEASVRREGRTIRIDASDIVPGDIIALQSGDKVPADARLFHVKDLQVDESILTGESVPVIKSSTTVPSDLGIADRINMAYSGTLVTYGQALGVAVETGANTEVGHISTMIGKVETLMTPLSKKMAQFAHWLTASILAIATLTFTYGILVRNYSPSDMFLATVGLVVAAIPEGLPAIMTITLAIGVQAMARRNAIIRRLPAVETLGSVTVICSDKTGTLTRNEMTAQTVVTADAVFDVTGTGYDPHGSFVIEGEDVDIDEWPLLEEIVRAGALCNDSNLRSESDQWRLEGDPTEGALLTLAMKAKLDLDYENEQWSRTDVIPFESQHRFMATLHHNHVGHGFIYVKGAPERILEMCNQQRQGGEDCHIDMVFWHQAVESLANRGQRMLAIAFKATEIERRSMSFSDLEGGLTLLGMIGMIDPPRDEVIAAIGRCQQAGIEVKMITGDHVGTALAIAQSIGMATHHRALSGHDLDRLSDEQLRTEAPSIDVFARASPEHKLRLVAALQAAGAVTAMTGDGVNDAPALKRADVGIAMGKKGTEAAKEASEMVLADDNFASIVNAVEEGRTVYDNIRKAILFILPTNGGEALTLIVAIVFGRALPITPVQILWINMVTAVTLAVSLAFEPPEPNVMRRPPRDPREPLMSPLLLWRIISVSLILVSGTFALFVWERARVPELAVAQTVAVNTLVMFEIFYLFNARYISASVLNAKGLLGNRYALYAIAVLVFLQLLLTYLPSMQTLFGTAAIDAAAWGRIVVVAASVLFIVELEKAILRRA